MSCTATSSQRNLFYRSATVSNDLYIVIVVRSPTTEQKQVRQTCIFILEMNLKCVERKGVRMRFVKSLKGNGDPQKAAQRTARKIGKMGVTETKSQVFNKENGMKLSSKRRMNDVRNPLQNRMQVGLNLM